MSTNAVPPAILQRILQGALGGNMGGAIGSQNPVPGINLSGPGATPGFAPPLQGGPQAPPAMNPAMQLVTQNAPSPTQTAQPQVSPTADIDPQELQDKAYNDYLKGNPDKKKRDKELNDVIDSIKDQIIPAEPNLAQQAMQKLNNLPNTPEWQKTTQDIQNLRQQANTPIDVPTEVGRQLGYPVNNKKDYINAKTDAVYGSQGKLGKVAQFISDVLKKPGAPSGVQAAYSVASDEWDKALKGVQDQIQSEKVSQQGQITANRQDLNQMQMQAKNDVDVATRDQAERSLGLRSLEQVANLTMAGEKLDTQENQLAFNQAAKAWQQFSGLTDPQIMSKLTAQLKATGMDQGSAMIRAKQIMMASESLKHPPLATGTSSTQTINPNTLATTTSTQKTYSNPALQLLQDPFGLNKLKPQANSINTNSSNSSIPPVTPPTPQGPNLPTNPLLKSVASTGTPNAGALAQQIGNLQFDPNTVSKRGGPAAQQMIMGQAKQVWDARPWDETEMGRAKPDWSEGLYKQVQSAEKDYGTGSRSKNVDAFNTAIRHVDLLNETAKALGTGNTPLFNKLNQAWSTQTGEPQFTNVETIADRLGKEIAKAYVAGGGGVNERQHIEDEFSAVKSPAQLQGTIQKNMQLLSGAMKTLQTRYKQDTLGVGTKQLVNPDVQQIINKLSPGTSAPAIGEIVDGYKFKGGDPKDKNNWAQQ